LANWELSRVESGFSFAVSAGGQREKGAMKILFSGIAGAVVLAVIAAAVLSMAQDPAYQVYSSSSTRLGNPGANLIGNTWSEREAGSSSGSAETDRGTGRTAY
jgi:hypothetical protein